MINIISLTALRNKVNGPGKVVKNLMKGLDIIGYPYVLNRALDSTDMLWIHDDFFALRHLPTLPENTKTIIGPNLYALPRAVPSDLHLDIYPHLMPANWVVDYWAHFGYTGILDSWAAGIDTEEFTPSHRPKTQVIIYFKQRKEEELEQVMKILESQDIKYAIIRYGNYHESDFQKELQSTKYVVWIGCSESQGIAFGEILASGIPILVWDIDQIGKCNFPANSFTQEELAYPVATSAPYFDDSCGIRVFNEEELNLATQKMEGSWQDFSPREYIEKNLSLAGQAQKFVDLYNKHYHVSLDQKIELSPKKMKSFRNNNLITFLFDIYDSRLGVYIRKIIKK